MSAQITALLEQVLQKPQTPSAAGGRHCGASRQREVHACGRAGRGLAAGWRAPVSWCRWMGFTWTIAYSERIAGS